MHESADEPRSDRRAGPNRPRARAAGRARRARQAGRRDRAARDRGAVPVSAVTPEAPRTTGPRKGDAHSGSPGTLTVVGALLRKELLVKLRTLESVPGMSLFAVSTFVVFHFALNQNSASGDEAAGILWVTLLFAAMLGVNRLFVADAEQGGFDGFLLAPVDRTAMLLAKALTLLAYLVVLELVAIPAFALLLLGPSLAQALPDLLGVLALADVGIAAIGTLVAALAVQTRARDLLGPLLALPLLVPIVIAGGGRGR